MPKSKKKTYARKVKASPPPTPPVKGNTISRNGESNRKWLIGIIVTISLTAATIYFTVFYDKNKPDSYNESLLQVKNIHLTGLGPSEYTIIYQYENLNSKNIQVIYNKCAFVEDDTTYAVKALESAGLAESAITIRSLSDTQMLYPPLLSPYKDEVFSGRRTGYFFGEARYIHPEFKDTFQYDYMVKVKGDVTQILKSENSPVSK